MATLGALVGILAGLLVVLVVIGTPLVIALHFGQRVHRAWRRARQEQRPRQPYDDAYQRAVWDVAARNGYAAALEDLRALERR